MCTQNKLFCQSSQIFKDNVFLKGLCSLLNASWQNMVIWLTITFPSCLAFCAFFFGAPPLSRLCWHQPTADCPCSSVLVPFGPRQDATIEWGLFARLSCASVSRLSCQYFELFCDNHELFSRSYRSFWPCSWYFRFSVACVCMYAYMYVCM